MNIKTESRTKSVPLQMIISLVHQRSSLFLFLLGLSLLACTVLFSTFLSTTSASDRHSTFNSFAERDGDSELWRKISAFDRVVFIVVDALRSARVQVSFIVLSFAIFIDSFCATGSCKPLEQLSKAVRVLPWPPLC